MKIISGGKSYNAHTSENNLHYPVGAKVEFSVYLYEGIPAAKITKLVNAKEALKFFEDLHKDLPAYFVYKLEELYPSVTDFAKSRGLKYIGPVEISGKVRYLFQPR